MSVRNDATDARRGILRPSLDQRYQHPGRIRPEWVAEFSRNTQEQMKLFVQDLHDLFRSS